jgi:mono/diheme cytochrome c family protein
MQSAARNAAVTEIRPPSGNAPFDRSYVRRSTSKLTSHFFPISTFCFHFSNLHDNGGLCWLLTPQHPETMQDRRNKTSHAVPCRRLALFVALALSAVTTSGSASAQIDFNRDIRPILSDNCFACHGPDNAARKAGLRLDLKEEAFKQLGSSEFAFVPGKPEQSKALKLVAAENSDDRMPPEKSGKRLTASQIDLLTRWVREGALWDDHWAYIPPQRPEAPEVKDTGWPHNPIDHFILSRLEKEGLKPAPEASKPAVLRRVTFDLTGLPPSIQEVDAFLADESPEAYEKVVDRLLASARYGERMAVPWLDLARYADTSGYHFDGFRQMSIWRDWVINAFNSNMPFDQFTIEQLAGDLLPDATREQKIATGFHRNVMTNDEGGADPDEYLSKYMVDRVNTTAAAWLGLTMSCAECHDHKYDRLSQKEYYQFYAFFHNVPEKGLDGTRVANPAPKMQVPSPEQESEMARLTGALSEAEQLLKTRETELPSAQVAWEEEVRANPGAPEEPPGLLALFSFDEDFSWTGGAEGNEPAQFKGAETAVWEDGKIGKALRLTGGEDYVDAGQAVAYEGTNAFSYGCWTKFHGNDGTLLSKMEAAPGHRGFDLILEGGRLAAHLVHAWPDNAIKVQTKDPLPTNRWLHVMMTYDGSSKAAGVKLFVNGKLQTLETKTDKLSASIATDTALRIGRRIDSSRMNGLIDDVRFYGRALDSIEIVAVAAIPHLALVQVDEQDRAEEHNAELNEFFRMHFASDFIAAQEEVAGLKKARDDLNKAIPDTMVMVEMEKPRETFVLVRGDFQTKGERVEPGVPSVLPPLPADQPANRLTLAQWLVSPEQPLTSRVTVNRLWQMFFGSGIVKTLNDFGAQGEWPSHPELLDWLAVEFTDPQQGAVAARPWDIKHLVRLIVTSSTYRQSALIHPEALERDPYNRLLSRGPRLRLEVEFIRDNALAVSGLLNGEIGGPSIKPYQPSGIWTVTDHKYEPSTGEDLYRRGLYVFWKRAAHYPSFAAFDAPSRETCTLERPRTSTPLQSLVLMNDPVYVEAARVFGQRIIEEGGPDMESRITFAFRTVLARAPSEAEQSLLARTYAQQLETFQTNRSAAEELLKIGDSPKRENADPVELAAWTTVANVLLNLNETITK